MLNIKKASMLAAVSLVLAPAAFAANDYRDVVKNTFGHVAKSTNGNCVHTQWPSQKDECGSYPHGDIRSRVSKEQRTVYFDFNKSTLNAKEKTKLDELSRIIIESKQVESVDIVGYADMIGKSSYNKKLSQKRAQTVKSYLATKGLRTQNVSVEGLGETNPVTNCNASMARTDLIVCLAADRRVEIQLNVKQ